MLTIEQTDVTADLAANDAKARPTGTALVPMAPALQRAPASGLISRPDPIFVAHLIATAQQVPQTRRLRRAAPHEALLAYAAHLSSAQQTGRQTRQVI
jgi:hypothetical protein